jgi:glycosyltransferase involved in cell wall biosynthesis
MVLCAGLPPMPKEPRWTDPYGVPVRIFAHIGNPFLRDLWFSIGVAWTILREHRNYDVVYFLMQGLHLATGMPAARLFRKPILMKVSGSSILTTMHRRSFVGRIELCWLRKWAYRVMVLNSGMEEEALAAGLEKKQLYWMPNPVDTAEFAPATPAMRCALRQEFGIPLDAAVIVFVGRLAPEKELPSLLRAFARTLEVIPQARLVVVGDGPEWERLHEIAAGLALAGRVLFTGREPSARVLCWLRLADVFTLVSSNEGLSCSLLEAMSTGLPSVVSAIPANVQLVEHGVHGFHAPVNDEDKLAEAFIQLLRDDSSRAAMARAARRLVVDSYSVDNVVDRYEQLFRAALPPR